MGNDQKGSRAALITVRSEKDMKVGVREEEQVLKHRVSLLRCFSNTLAHD